LSIEEDLRRLARERAEAYEAAVASLDLDHPAMVFRQIFGARENLPSPAFQN
jgi:predicted kinase